MKRLELMGESSVDGPDVNSSSAVRPAFLLLLLKKQKMAAPLKSDAGTTGCRDEWTNRS